MILSMGGETFYQLLDKYTRELWVYRAYIFFFFFSFFPNLVTKFVLLFFFLCLLNSRYAPIYGLL